MRIDNYKQLKIGDKFTNTSTIMDVFSGAPLGTAVSFLFDIPIGTIFEITNITEYSTTGLNTSTLIYYTYRFNNEVRNSMFMINSHNASKCVMYLREDNLIKLGI